jgi:hypothetical protein
MLIVVFFCQQARLVTERKGVKEKREMESSRELEGGGGGGGERIERETERYCQPGLSSPPLLPWKLGRDHKLLGSTYQHDLYAHYTISKMTM